MNLYKVKIPHEVSRNLLETKWVIAETIKEVTEMFPEATKIKLITKELHSHGETIEENRTEGA